MDNTDPSQVQWDDNVPPAELNPNPTGVVWDEDKYGTVPQQVLTGVEGVAKGVLGPVATGTEEVLSRSGIPGLSAKERMGRAEANPWISGGSEAAGFAGSMLLGTGEAALVGHAGEAAAKAAGLGLEGASTISKIASAGIKTGSEMAAIQTGDEISKAINQDPNQSLGSAAINVGLSSIIGGGAGMSIASVSPLWKMSMEKMGIPKLIDDAKAQYGFRQSIPGGDVQGAITNELTGRMGEVDTLKSQMNDLKGDSIEKALPEIDPKNTAKIDDQIQGIVNSIDSKIKYIEKSDDPYLKGSIAKLEFHKQQLLDATEEGFKRGRKVELIPGVPKVAQEEVRFTPIRFDENPSKSAFPWLTDADAPPKLVRGEEQVLQSRMLNPNPTKPVQMTPIEFQGKSYLKKFEALDSLKRDFQGLVNYERNSAEDSAIASIVRPIASDIRSGLEDSNVWGDAGNVQRKVNAAISSSIKAEKDASSKFTSKVMGDRVADPTKVNTLVNQTLKGKAGLKTDIMQNYLDHTQDLADTINKIHTDAGLEAPIRLTPTPALDHTLGRSSAGTTLGNWLYDKGLASVAGHLGGEGLGAGLGSVIGHPVYGALAGDRLFSPAITAMAKPLLEKASNSEALKGTIDYIGSVIKGDKLLSRGAENIFKGAAEIIPEKLMPNEKSREKLEESIDSASNIDNAVNIGKNLAHYLPSHQTAAGVMSANAINYLKSIKPIQQQISPLDTPSKVSKGSMAEYNRQLDIAQQPLLALEHVKNGTLHPQDITTLKTIYPSLYNKMVNEISKQMINAKAEGKSIPYRQKISMSMFIGQPLETNMAPPAVQSIIRSNAPKTPPQQQQGKPSSPSKVTSTQMAKVNKMYSTPDQARAASRTTNGS